MRRYSACIEWLFAEEGDSFPDRIRHAHAAGLTDVVIPERNRGDLEDVPEHVREELTFHPVMSLDEVLGFALEPTPSQRHVSV